MPIVLMHTRGRSRDMYQQAVYHDVVDEVLDELRESMAFAAGAGIPDGAHARRSRAGLREGGAATASRCSARLHEFAELGRPMVVGPSRKIVSHAAAGAARRATPPTRDWATAAAVTAAVLCRRAHRARARRAGDGQVVRVADEIRKYHRDV